jgi:PEP-CTERM motif
MTGEQEDRMKLLAPLAVIGVLALAPQMAGAVVVGQTDTFQDLTTDGWFAGLLGMMPPVPPHVVATGGPGGAGDAFLEITGLGGLGAGSKITALNNAQWAGNYLAAGVTGIAMDLKNLGLTELTVRLQLEDAMGGPPADEAVTSFGAVLAVGGDWARFVFPISPADLTVVVGDAATLLSQVTFLRIIQNPLPGESAPVVGVLGVDNISAIPEPSSLALIASAALAGFMAYRRRRSS